MKRRKEEGKGRVMERELWGSWKIFGRFGRVREGRGKVAACEVLEDRGKKGRRKGGEQSREECSSSGRNLGRVKNP